MGMLEAFGRFMGKLVEGDMNGAMDVLHEDPGGKVERTCKGCLEKTHKAGDPPCNARDGEFACVAHNEDGSCVMGRRA